MLATTFLAAFLTQAAASAPSYQDDLSETRVTAPRSELPETTSAAGLTVITGAELAQTGESTLPRAIAQAAGPAGAWVQETNLGGGTVFLRGLTGNQILIVVDGVRLNDSTTRFGPNQSLNTIDPATVERVEILRGPGSVLYGSDAIGGTVLIWTKRRRAARSEEGRGVSGFLDLLYRDVVEGGSASLGLSDATEQYGWQLIGTAFDYDDLRGGDGDTQDFTGYNGNAFFGSVDIPLGSDRDLRVTSSIHRDFDVPRTDRLNAGFGQTDPAFDVFRFALQRRERHLIAFEDRSGLGSLADRFQIRGSFRRYDEQRERQSFGSTTFRTEQDRVETFGVGADFKKAIGENHLLTYGLDVDYDQVDSARTDTDLGTGIATPRDGQFAPAARYLSSGLFLQDEIFVFDPWILTAGVRYSFFDFSFDRFADGRRESGDFSALTASIQGARDLGEGFRVTAGLAQGFRAPNLAELAQDGSFGGGTELSNPDLDPEQSLSLDFGLDYSKGATSAWVGIWGTQIDDIVGRTLIDVGDPGVLGDETYRRENQGEVELYGIEVGLRQRLAEDSPFVLETGASYQRGEQTDDEIATLDGVPWRRVPPLYGRVEMAWEPFFNRADAPEEGSFTLTRAALELPWAGEQDRLSPGDESDPRIGVPTPGWAVLNLRLSGTFGEGGSAAQNTWQIGVANVFDKDYRVHGSGFDAPGRGLFAGLRLRF